MNEEKPCDYCDNRDVCTVQDICSDLRTYLTKENHGEDGNKETG